MTETTVPAVGEVLKDAPTNWGKWGSDDEVGALNYLGPEQVLTDAIEIFQQLAETRHLDVDDRSHVRRGEPVEQDDLVQSVQELRSEVAAHDFHHLRLDLFDRFVLAK